MVCQKCTKKLAKLAAPDAWKDGARNTADKVKKKGANKLLAGKSTRFNPYDKIEKCRVCKTKVHQPHSKYCQQCAYKLGICAMCGKMIADVKNLKQSS
eukprot:m.14618 g.14618  ORF g.14618 m.14618 type:complete len:98 (-) comp10319_c0_seq3:989-1282(-)